MNKIILEIDNDVSIKISNINNGSELKIDNTKLKTKVETQVLTIIEYVKNTSKEDFINKKPIEVLSSLNIVSTQLYLSLLQELIYEKYKIKSKPVLINNKTTRVFSEK